MSTFALSETGNAERFVAIWGSAVRFVPEWNAWVIWNGKHWQRDVGNIEVERWVKATCRSIAAEADAELADPKAYQAALRWALRSDSVSVRRATLQAARSEVATVKAEQFDRQHMLLNFSNGTLDLETGRLRDHDRGDLIARAIGRDHDPAAEAPRFVRFLAEVLPPDAVEFLWRAVGYSLTGRVDEHALFFAHGPGANGKSTLLELLLELLGPYAGPAEPDLLLARQSETHPVGRADLHGKRLSVAQEIDTGRSWAEATVKTLTGGDRIQARRMHENFWSFEPTHKFWIGANSRPAVRGGGEALWRRIKLIPFDRIVPPEKRERDLQRTLRAELAGITAWAVRGCTRYLEDGLGTSSAVSVAVEDYRRESDPFAAFVTDRCIVGSGRVFRSDFAREYGAWCSANGHEAIEHKDLVAKIRVLHGVKAGSRRRPKGNPEADWIGLSFRERRDVETVESIPRFFPMRDESLEKGGESSLHVTTPLREGAL